MPASQTRRIRMRRLRRVPLSRYWRMFVVALGVLAALGAALVLLVPDMAGLFLLAVYCIPTNSVIPIPHEPGLLYFARYYDPLWIALAATAGSVVVSFSDYALVEWGMRHPRTQGARETRVFRWAVRWMARAPFWIVVIFSLVPFLPLSPIRILAPASGYPVWRYIGAQIVGRTPRFFALAWLGATVQLPTWAILSLFGIMVLSLAYGSRSAARPEAEVVAEGAVVEAVVVPDLSDPEHPVEVASLADVAPDAADVDDDPAAARAIPAMKPEPSGS
jgi:membrane protein YqaA with SNARE-associated domain